MKRTLLGLLIFLFILASLADRLHGPVDDTAPRRTLLKRQRKGGGGGGNGDSDDTDSGGSDDGGDDAPCVPETRIVERPGDPDHYNWRGYGGNEKKGPGSKGSISGGFTKNGTGSLPPWIRANGNWTLTDFDLWRDVSYSFDHSRNYYFGGALVPYTAGQKSSHGLVPSLTSIDFGARRIQDLDWRGIYPEDVFDCQMPELLQIYRYPVAYNYTVMEWNGQETAPVDILPITALCACNPESVCACDYPDSDPGFVDSLGNYTVTERSSFISNLRVYNSTLACYLPLLNGTPTLLVNGTLKDGSTKADPSIPEPPKVTETVDVVTCAAAEFSLSWVWIGTITISTMLCFAAFSS